MENVTDDLVQEIAFRRWGLSPRRRGREWHSPCPVCGGEDRFVIFKNGGYWCRQCGLQGWLDDDAPRSKPDPLVLQRHAEELARRRREQAERDRAWARGYEAGYWQGWHDAMQATHRMWWHARGVTDRMIDYYGLGYCPKKLIVTRAGVEIVTPAYTIPIRDPRTWEVVGMHYRLEAPPPGEGKYRYEKGITARAFYAAPGDIAGTALVVEGAVKAMVCYDRDGSMQVVGLPGCTPSEALRDEISGFDQIYIALDPDAGAAAVRLREALLEKRHGKFVRLLRLPGKPDDLWLSGALTLDRLHEYMRQAR